MANKSCLAGVDDALVPMLSSVLLAAGAPAPVFVTVLDVAELGKIAPTVLVCDVDALEIDSLEFLRQIRFVLPDCLIAVYSNVLKHGWGVACHLAGVNCMLSKASPAKLLTLGVRNAIRTGCYTDPRFAAA